MAGELLDLGLSADPALRQRVVLSVYQTIEGSFKADRSRVTTSETTRRFRICEQLLRELRRDHGWAFTRICDVLPTALRAKLDGIPWSPDTSRALWLA